MAAAAAVSHGSPDVPKWQHTYNMTQSTVVMPCNESGYADPKLFSRFGISDFDWSNAKVEWSNAKPMDCEERLVTQAGMVKAVNPTARVFVYRNLVKVHAAPPPALHPRRSLRACLFRRCPGTRR